MTEEPEDRAHETACACGGAASRRAMLAGASALGLGAVLDAAGARAEGADERPKEGDHLVSIDAATPVALEPKDIAAPQIIAWPMDPAGAVVRNGSRLNKVLLVRLDPATLLGATRERAADGIVQTLVQAGGTVRAATMGTRTGTVALNGVGGSIVVEGQLATPGTAPGTTGGAIVANRPVVILRSPRRWPGVAPPSEFTAVGSSPEMVRLWKGFFRLAGVIEGKSSPGRTERP